jgi:hypothetical protein
MMKLFEVSLAQNGWIVSYPPEDEWHIQQDSLYLENRGDIEGMLYDLAQALAININDYTVTIKVKKVKKPSKKELYWKDPAPIPMPPIKEIT